MAGSRIGNRSSGAGEAEAAEAKVVAGLLEQLPCLTRDYIKLWTAG